MTAGVLRETFHIDAEVVTERRTGKPACISYDLIRDQENSCGY